MPDLKNNGIVRLKSPYTVAETVQRLRTVLAAKGVTEFCTISHSGEAAKVGMQMRPTELIIFGSPKAGTPAMIASPSLAIDLPLKALISENEAGEVYLSYNSVDYLTQRHALPVELAGNLAAIKTICEEAVR